MQDFGECRTRPSSVYAPCMHADSSSALARAGSFRSLLFRAGHCCAGIGCSVHDSSRQREGDIECRTAVADCDHRVAYRGRACPALQRYRSASVGRWTKQASPPGCFHPACDPSGLLLRRACDERWRAGSLDRSRDTAATDTCNETQRSCRMLAAAGDGEQRLRAGTVATRRPIGRACSWNLPIRSARVVLGFSNGAAPERWESMACP